LAELGLVIVGPVASRLNLDIGEGIPVVKVRSEPITPIDEDLSAMVGYAATGTFHGPDADRWKLLTDQQLRSSTEMLWACAQVQSAAVAQAASQWDRVLIVSWVDEPGVTPIARQLATLKRPVTVLLGGSIDESRGAPIRRNQVVLAELLRQDGITNVIYNPEPERVLDVAMESARSPEPLSIARSKPVDLGPLLDLPPTWCLPAAPVQFFHLVHVPMGYAAGLPELSVNVAAYRALHDLVTGPPVDIAGAEVVSPDEARAKLPSGDVHSDIQGRIREALEQVRFRGSEMLVEQIEDVLRPILDEVTEIARSVVEVERNRLHHLRQFTAVGINYTCQNLSSRLDAIRETYPRSLVDELDELISGTTPAADDGTVHISNWRKTFAGLHSYVVRRSVPGSGVAVALVKERFDLFKSEYSASMARILGALVERARDPEAPASSRELRSLRERAIAVRTSIEEALARLDEKIDTQCEQAVRDDRLVRWAAPTGAQLRTLLSARIQSLPCAAELDSIGTEALARRRLGMADDRDFEGFQQELAVAVHGLAEAVQKIPSYEACLLVVLHGRDPPVLRQALAKSAGSEVELHLERPVEPALMNWLTATGMLVVVAPRLQTCAIYWQRAEAMSIPGAETSRSAQTEHRMADLVLPPPEGDNVSTLVGLVRAACYVLVGLVVGELRVVRHESLSVHEVVSDDLGLPELVLLPHGALHLFAHDAERLVRLRGRLEQRIAGLPLRADGTETVGKLIELATLGPSPTLAAQIGLYGARFEHLEHPIHAMLQVHANLAVAAMVDCLHSEDLAKLTRPRNRRALLDVQQLGPSGG